MPLTRAWLYLVIAGLFEIVWAIALKRAHGFSRPGPSALTVSGMAASFWFLSQALTALPVGTAYAVWTGIGAAGTAVLGMLLLGEPRTALRLLCIGLIVLGMIGLKASTPAS